MNSETLVTASTPENCVAVQDTTIALIPPQEEKKEEEEWVEKLDWSKVLAPANVANILVVVSKKHEKASNQRLKVSFIPPDMIVQNPSPEALEGLDNVEALTSGGEKYPKVLVLSAIMKLQGNEQKWCAPGNDPAAKKNDGERKEATKLENLKRSFWCKTDDVTGIDPDILEAEGGAEALLKKQKDSRTLLHEAQKTLAMKWWYSPMNVKELKKNEIGHMSTYKFIKQNITWSEVVQIMGSAMLQNHAQMGILANMQQSGSNNIGEGIPFQANVWYRPNDVKFRTDEMNQKEVDKYVKRIMDLKAKFPQEDYVVNETIVKALLSGLREHIIPTFVIQDGKFVLFPPHPDPTKSNLKSGDFVKIEYMLHPYDNLKGAGQSLFVNRIFIFSQSVGVQQKVVALDPKYAKLKNFVPRFIEPPKLEPAIVKEETAVQQPLVIQVKTEVEHVHCSNPVVAVEQAPPGYVPAASAPIEPRANIDVDVQSVPIDVQGKPKRTKYQQPTMPESGIPDEFNMD